MPATLSASPPPDVDPATIAHQFRLDVPRIAVSSGAHALDSARTTALSAYVGKWAARHGHSATAARYWCTQIALAPLYTQKVRALAAARAASRSPATRMATTHLIDDGAQTVALGEEGVLRVYKPFKVVCEAHHVLYPLRRLGLHVRVHPDTARVEWVEEERYTGASAWYDDAVGDDAEEDRATWWATVALLAAWGALQAV